MRTAGNWRQRRRSRAAARRSHTGRRLELRLLICNPRAISPECARAGVRAGLNEPRPMPRPRNPRRPREDSGICPARHGEPGWGGRARVEDEHRFLAEATVALASSLDYEATLARIPHLAVPPLADWCSVDLLERDGAVRRIGLACADSLKHITAESGSRILPTP